MSPVEHLDHVERVYRAELRDRAPTLPMLRALRDLRGSLQPQEPAPATPVASDAPTPPGADIAASKSDGAGDSNQPYLVHLHGGWSTACGIPLRAVHGTTSPVLSTVTCPACCLAAEVDG